MRERGQSSVGMAPVTPIILACAPRSGSSWLRNVLGVHPAIATGPETYAFEAIAGLLASIERRAAHGQGLLARKYFTAQELHQACADFFLSAIRSRTKGRPYFIEKTPLNTDFIDIIHAVFPHAKMIHIIRDGRDVAYSMLAAQRQRRYHLPDTVRGCAERWGLSAAVTEFGRTHPELYCEVRYEALLADLSAELTRIFAFLYLRLDAPVLAAMCGQASCPPSPSDETAAR